MCLCLYWKSSRALFLRYTCRWAFKILSQISHSYSDLPTWKQTNFIPNSSSISIEKSLINYEITYIYCHNNKLDYAWYSALKGMSLSLKVNCLINVSLCRHVHVIGMRSFLCFSWLNNDSLIQTGKIFWSTHVLWHSSIQIWPKVEFDPEITTKSFCTQFYPSSGTYSGDYEFIIGL